MRLGAVSQLNKSPFRKKGLIARRGARERLLHRDVDRHLSEKGCSREVSKEAFK